jgi:hypothetical protein
MEGTPLYELLQALRQPTPLPSLSVGDITVRLYTSSEPNDIQVTGLAPFHTIEDVHRAAWLQEGNNDIFPKYSFMGIEEDGHFVPATRTWYSGDEDSWVKLEDPRSVIGEKRYNPEFVTDDGEKRESIRSTPRGRSTLDTFKELPVFHIFSLSYLLRGYTGARPISQKDWIGLFYPYFPAIQNNYEFTDRDDAFATKVAVYIKSKLEQTQIINSILEIKEPKELKTIAVKHLLFRWAKPVAGFEGADVLFYGASVNSVRPFMRLLTPNTTPMTKLYQPDITRPPMVNDVTLLRTWTSERSPESIQNILFIKALVRKEQLGVPPLFGTFRVNDDATADFTVQPPKGTRILEFNKDLSILGQVMMTAAEGLPFEAQDASLDSADITVQLDFGGPAPKNIRSQVLSRLKKMGTFFQPVIPPTQETRPPLICLRYKGVNNFTTPDRIQSFITYIVQRNGFSLEKVKDYRTEIANEFEIPEDEAEQILSDYLTKKDEMAVTDPDSKEFSPLNNIGTDIAIYSQSISSFVFQIYNLQSIQDLLRIVSILSSVFLIKEDEWDDLLHGVKVEEEEEVADASAEVEEDERAQEGPPKPSAYAGFNFENSEEEVQPTVAQAAAATVQATAGKKPTLKLATKAPPPAKKEESEQKIIAFQYYIQRLQRADPVLFTYKSAVARSDYVSKCQASDDRQPAVFSEEEYLRIRKLYLDDESKGKVGFIVYGIPTTQKTIDEAKGKLEQFHVMRYGSNTGSPNYYICPPLLCLRDMLPILTKEFNSSKDREGNDKAKQSCPFCHGTLIANASAPLPGQTVLKRKNAPKSDKPHSFIGFLKSGIHPQGYDLPCCFTKLKNISWDDAKFKIMREKPKSHAEIAEENEMNSEADRRAELEESLKLRVQEIINYEQLRYKISREYVVGAEKYPLEPGKVGLGNLSIDEYFGQDSSKMVERPSVKMEFTGNVRGFFRVGVFNKALFINQSLFSALAPLIGKNSIPEVIDHMKRIITPRVFINLNFGNLLLEFFKPNDPEPSITTLNSWALTHLQVDTTKTKEELSRFWRAYKRFEVYLSDPTQLKQLRHFSHALAEPGLLTATGLNIIVIEYLGDPRDPATQVQIDCPLLGIEASRYNNNNVGFLTHSSIGIWEPLVYIERIAQKGAVTSVKEGYYTLTKNDIIGKTMPTVVRSRYLEYLERCKSSYRGAFTLQSHVDNRVLVPITRALEMLQTQPVRVVGLVRDTYNHLVGLTVNYPLGSPSDIVVPIVDDGNSFHYNTDLKIHLGLQSTRLPTATNVIEFYKAIGTPLFAPLSSVYTLVSVVKTVSIIAYRLGGKDSYATILLPCEDGAVDVPIEDVGKTNFQFEYQINRSLMFTKTDDTWDTSHSMNRDQVQDIYEHLRLAFANWIARDPDGEEMRKRTNILLESTKIPNYEKIRRLELEYTPLITSWLSPDPEYTKVDFTLLRKDCLSMEEDACSGSCAYSDGKCKIHTPDQFQLGKHKVEASKYLSIRLFDEIIRLPARRYELFNKAVKRVQIPRTNIHVGNEWILPENVPAWYELLRETKSSLGRELPQFYEEFSRPEATEEEHEALAKEVRLFPLPDALLGLLPEATADKMALQVIGTRENPVHSILRDLGLESLYTEEMKFDPKVLGDISKKYNQPVISIDLDPFTVIGRSHSILSLKSSVFVFIPEYELGPAVLVDKTTLERAIPASWIKGRVFDSIEVVKLKLKRLAVPEAEPVKVLGTRTVKPKP